MDHGPFRGKWWVTLTKDYKYNYVPVNGTLERRETDDVEGG